MKDYGTVTGSVEPEELEVNDLVVRVASDIEEIEIEIEGETTTQYQYHLIEFTKDEYITLMTETQEQQTADIDYLMMITEDL